MRAKGRFPTATNRQLAMRLGISALLVVSSFLLAGCRANTSVAVNYQLPFVPVTFSLDSSGHFSVSLGYDITTPIGTFSVSAEIGTPIPENSTRVSIVHTINGLPAKDVYDIAERGQMNICLDGRFWENVGDNSITITPLDGDSTISIVQSGSQCTTATSSPAANLDTSTADSPETSAPAPPATPAPQANSGVAGVWTGTYTCAQGLTDLRLTINDSGGGALTAIFDFYADSSNPGTPSGSFAMTGTYSASGLVLDQDHWINQPDGYSMVNLVAPPPSGNTIQGTVEDLGGCTTFSISR